MEWTKPLSLILVALVILLIIGSIMEFVQTTVVDSQLYLASIITTALVLLVVIIFIGLGFRNRRWITNPDSYW